MSLRSDVPIPVVRRLSLYLRQLEVLETGGTSTVSSRTLARSLGLTDAQVRKDLTYFGQFGRPGIGYEVTGLIQRLRAVMGTDKITATLLVGVGNLGRALAAYEGFGPKGFELVAIFDVSSKKVGQKIGGLAVQDMRRMEKIIADRSIRLGMMSVPAAAAQAVADRLIGAGIRGILNFAPGVLKVPDNVTVHTLDVASELEQLSFLARDTS